MPEPLANLIDLHNDLEAIRRYLLDFKSDIRSPGRLAPDADTEAVTRAVNHIAEVMERLQSKPTVPITGASAPGTFKPLPDPLDRLTAVAPLYINRTSVGTSIMLDNPEDRGSRDDGNDALPVLIDCFPARVESSGGTDEANSGGAGKLTLSVTRLDYDLTDYADPGGLEVNYEVTVLGGYGQQHGYRVGDVIQVVAVGPAAFAIPGRQVFLGMITESDYTDNRYLVTEQDVAASWTASDCEVTVSDRAQAPRVVTAYNAAEAPDSHQLADGQLVVVMMQADPEDGEPSYWFSHPVLNPDELDLTHDLLSATHTDTTPDAVVAGDLIRGQGEETASWARLPVGNNDDLLQVKGGLPTWVPPDETGEYTAKTHNLLSDRHPDTTTASPSTGAMIVGGDDETSKWEVLPPPNTSLEVDYVLMFNQGETMPAWGQPTHSLLSGYDGLHTDTEAATPVAGALIRAVSIDATTRWSMLAPGTNGQVLTITDGLPEWEDLPGAGAGSVVSVSKWIKVAGVGSTTIDSGDWRNRLIVTLKAAGHADGTPFDWEDTRGLDYGNPIVIGTTLAADTALAIWSFTNYLPPGNSATVMIDKDDGHLYLESTSNNVDWHIWIVIEGTEQKTAPDATIS